MRRAFPASGLAAASLMALASCATAPRAPASVRYLDAHSHIAEGMTADEEIAAFRAAGLAGLVLIHPEPETLKQITARYPGYVAPAISLARLPEMPGLRLSPDAARTMAALQAEGMACQFGEIPTRIVPRAEASDDLALLNPDRRKIYAEANRLQIPVNLHVDIAGPAVAAAIERIASDNPYATIVLAHAGWSASADTLARLMARHANIMADLSVRLDPAEGLPSEPPPPGTPPPGTGQVISILAPDGSIRPDWRAVMARFPDRFLFAMDVTQSERPKHIRELLAIARKALSALGPRTENAIAHGNLERLLARCPARLRY